MAKRAELSPVISQQLAGFGISRADQTLAGLQAYFPSEFEIDGRYHDVNELAELLLYLARARVIQPILKHRVKARGG